MNKNTFDTHHYLVHRCSDFSIDGKLNSAEWKKAEVWPFMRLIDRDPRLGEKLIENGEVRMLCSDEYLYIGVRMDDSDVVQQGVQDQSHFYLMGDTIEVFLKPDNDTYYWEMYGTPNERRTTFFYPGRAYLFLPESASPTPEFQVKAFVDGELNNWQVRDKGWSIEFKFPLSTFEQYGAKFKEGNLWRFLVARQNYSRPLPMKELSTVPQIRESDFHILEQYGYLEIEKK